MHEINPLVRMAVTKATTAPRPTEPRKMLKNLATVRRKAPASKPPLVVSETLSYSSMELQRTRATASLRRLSPSTKPFSMASTWRSCKREEKRVVASCALKRNYAI